MDNIDDATHSPASPVTNLPAISPRQLAARRANAQKCTGPRTPHGKAAARLNALKHGFFARDVVNRELDGAARAEEFKSLLDALLEEFQTPIRFGAPPGRRGRRILLANPASAALRMPRILGR